ncbi:MAG: hypothetical protein WBP84_00150, partial [Nitrososphaeraceae archaeon]
RINHRTECYPSNQQPQVFLARLIIADIQIYQKSIFYLSKMQEQSDSIPKTIKRSSTFPRIRLLLVFDVIAKFMVICLKNLGLK